MNLYLTIWFIASCWVPSGEATLRAVDIERNLFELDQLLFKEWAYDVNGTGPCHEIMDTFSIAASQFILCANAHAKPISMCRECFPFYMNVTQSYEDMKTHSESGVSCIKILTSQDRLEIIEETYEYIAGKKSTQGTVNNDQKGLWHKGNCESCFSTPFDKNSVLSATTVDFFARHAIVNQCFQKFPYKENIPRNSSKACQVCQHYYQNLSEFYLEFILEKEAPFIDDACIDIVDAMNMTQRQWGEKYNCGRMVEHHVPLLVMVAVVLCMPIVFYSLVRLAETSAEERVISQRNITNFLGSNIRRLSFNRRSRVSRSSRHFSRDQFTQGNSDHPNILTVPSPDE
jgi:hypothetical protein